MRLTLYPGQCQHPAGMKLFSAPLWALQEAWPQLREGQRAHAAARAACHGQLATLRWALPAVKRTSARLQRPVGSSRRSNARLRWAAL